MVGEFSDVGTRLQGEHQDVGVPDLHRVIAGCGAVEVGGDRPPLDVGGRAGVERDPLLEPICQDQFSGRQRVQWPADTTTMSWR